MRPGLERVRDLAAEGHIQAVLVYSPDRVSRKYAYQVLLVEEFARHGVETDLLSLDDSHRRMPELRQRQQGLRTQLRAIVDQIAERAATLRLAETLSILLARLRANSRTLDVDERRLPAARVRHPWPEQRFIVKHPRWEPSALAAHARIRPGGAG